MLILSYKSNWVRTEFFGHLYCMIFLCILHFMNCWQLLFFDLLKLFVAI